MYFYNALQLSPNNKKISQNLTTCQYYRNNSKKFALILVYCQEHTWLVAKKNVYNYHKRLIFVNQIDYCLSCYIKQFLVLF